MVPRALPPEARLPLRLYRALFPLVFGCLLPGYLVRMLRRGGYGPGFLERFGRFSPEQERALEAASGGIWVHAVSVGEMVMALRLVAELRVQQPELPVIVSTTTSTGHALARKELGLALEPGAEGAATALIYYPLDLRGIVRRVFARVRPAQIVLVDKELWPNLLAHAWASGVPVSIVNARLSPRSERRFRKARRWVGPFFGMLRRVYVQEPEESARWHSLGVREEALECVGSLKFDYTPPTGPGREETFRRILAKLGWAETDPILLGGSTFPGEEAALARACLRLRQQHPALRLIVVPRHVERTPQARADLHAEGLRIALRTEPEAKAAGERAPIADALIVNTTGELRDWYRLATVCVIGKSLTAHGGQNPAEPLLVGRPIVLGPNMENFAPLVRQLLQAGGATQIPEETALPPAIAALLADPAHGAAQVRAGQQLLAVHRGANHRTAARLLGER